MTRWEYKIVDETHDVRDLAKLGHEGWELVAATSGYQMKPYVNMYERGEYSSGTLYLKRPLPEEKP